MGQPLSDETKQKISEALKKLYGNKGEDTQTNVQRSPQAQAMYNEFTKSSKTSSALKQQRDALVAQSQKLGRKKGSRAARAKIKAQIKAIREKMKAEHEKRQKLREQAQAAQREKRTSDMAQKASLRSSQLDSYEQRAQSMLTKAKTPEARAKVEQAIARIKDTRAKIADSLKRAQNSGGGKDSFNFEELDERTFKPYRVLTLQEKRTGMPDLNDEYNKQQADLEAELNDYADEEIDRFTQRADTHIKNRDYTAIAALLLYNRSSVKGIIRNAGDKAYNKGKTMAAKEVGVTRPNTPLEQVKIGNLEADDMATGIVNNISQAGKDVIKAGLAKNASDEAISKVAAQAMKAEAKKAISNATGVIVGQNINRGRSQVFTDNLDKISRFQRSEVLDYRTCDICMALDERVLPADDPMVSMDIVHANCRGVWIPVFHSDEVVPDFDPVPQSVKENFDLVDGRPIVNHYKQLKKPLKKAK